MFNRTNLSKFSSILRSRSVLLEGQAIGSKYCYSSCFRSEINWPIKMKWLYHIATQFRNSLHFVYIRDEYQNNNLVFQRYLLTFDALVLVCVHVCVVSIEAHRSLCMKIVQGLFKVNTTRI